MAENVVLNNLANLQNDTTTISVINGNNATITAAFSDVLSRSGVSPNTMGAPLDMNNWPIMNLPAPGSANSPARLVDVTGSNPINISLSLTGDVTAAASSGVLSTTIASGAVTQGKIATAYNNVLISSTNQQVFTSNGTYTPTTGMVFCTIEMVGGGGAGGGVTGTSGTSMGGGGGGSGAYSKASFSAATIGVSQSVTVGSGGTGVSAANGNPGTTTSVGTLLTAPGGGGGGFNNNSTNFGPPGSAASAGTSTSTLGTALLLTGTNGGNGPIINASSTDACGGYGANSFYGGGGSPSLNGTTNTAVAGNVATSKGAGGSGAAAFGTGSAAGGNGSSGLVVITEYMHP